MAKEKRRLFLLHKNSSFNFANSFPNLSGLIFLLLVQYLILIWNCFSIKFFRKSLFCCGIDQVTLIPAFIFSQMSKDTDVAVLVTILSIFNPMMEGLGISDELER